MPERARLHRAAILGGLLAAQRGIVGSCVRKRAERPYCPSATAPPDSGTAEGHAIPRHANIPTEAPLSQI
jgi:hypothetical protein